MGRRRRESGLRQELVGGREGGKAGGREAVVDLRTGNYSDRSSLFVEIFFDVNIVLKTCT